MPPPQRRTTAAAADKCNCELCSSPDDVTKKKAIIFPGPRRRPPRDRDDAECAPCAPRRYDIILRNKRAVKILSRKMQEHRALAEEEASCGGITKVLPTLKHARPPRMLPEALSSARTPCTSEKPQKKSKVTPIEDKPSLLKMLTKRIDCACELMAHTIRADFHKHLSLASQRQNINAGLVFTPSDQSLAPKPNLTKK